MDRSRRPGAACSPDVAGEGASARVASLRAQPLRRPQLGDAGRCAGADRDDGFKAEPGRYHLYVAFGCPWAHRTLIFRKLKGLEEHIPVSFTLPRRTDQGWVFDNRSEQCADTCLGSDALWEVYAKGHPGYTGRVTVPVLYDKQSGRMVSNESTDIVRMLNSAFDGVGARRTGASG